MSVRPWKPKWASAASPSEIHCRAVIEAACVLREQVRGDHVEGLPHPTLFLKNFLRSSACSCPVNSPRLKALCILLRPQYFVTLCLLHSQAARSWSDCWVVSAHSQGLGPDFCFAACIDTLPSCSCVSGLPFSLVILHSLLLFLYHLSQPWLSLSSVTSWCLFSYIFGFWGWRSLSSTVVSQGSWCVQGRWQWPGLFWWQWEVTLRVKLASSACLLCSVTLLVWVFVGESWTWILES